MLCLEVSLPFPVSGATEETHMKYWCNQDFLCWRWPIFATWSVFGLLVEPSFWREVGNPRRRFIVVIFFFRQPAQLFLQASSQFNSFLGFLGVDFARMGCNQNSGSSYGHISSEQPDGYTDVNVECAICPFFLALTFEWYHMSERCFISFLMEEKPAMLNLGVPWHTVFFFMQPPLCQPKTKVSFPHSSFASKIYAARVQDSGCILLREGNFLLSPGLLWQKLQSNPEH